jgi:hypothetical protein
MRKGKLNSPVRVILILLCTILLASLGWALFRNREPVYNGKTATEWMQNFYGANTPQSARAATPEWEESRRAIDHFGTNIIPYALKLARNRDSRLKQLIAQNPHSEKVAKFFGCGTAYSGWVFASVQNPRTAANVFRYLGPRAKPAVPALLELLGPKEDSNTREAAALMLTSIGTGAQEALPDLLCYWKEPDLRVRKAVQTAIIRISYGESLFARHQAEFPEHRAYTRRSADLIWPQIARLLRDPTPDLNFVDQICFFLVWNEDWAEGSGFHKLMSDPNEAVRTNATKALERINSPLWGPGSRTMPVPGPLLVPPPIIR